MSYKKPCDDENSFLCNCSNCRKHPKEKCNKSIKKCPNNDKVLKQCNLQEGAEQENNQEQKVVQVPIQEGPELDSSQDQSGNIMGPEQKNEQEQLTAQIPIQDGSEQTNDQDQITAQVPIQDGGEQEIDQIQLATQDGTEQELELEHISAQIPIQEGSTLDNQQNTTQTPTQEGPILAQAQIQDQNQEEDQFQLMGDQTQEQGMQFIEGHTNESPLENNQIIETSVSGVTVNTTLNVKCGCSVDDDKESKDCKCRDKNKRDCKKCIDLKDCCVKDLARLLNQVRLAQSEVENPLNQGIDIYFNGLIGLGNPTTDQLLTIVNNCDTVTFRPVTETTPLSTILIKNVSGIRATDNIDSDDDIFDFLLSLARTCFNDDFDCNKRKNCCEGEILSNLRAAQTFGLGVNLLVKGLPNAISNLFVFNICGCVAFFVNNLTAPTVIYAFSVCDISGYTVS
ncbi:hypothetical protein [Lysinibacillus sp. SGAir0095]|uniref:hypothetical protein n=1 Tax=Lysinibacillus sp. SGAir0095 TaxID=2070463 RepID=UPI0010CCC835|nr:hypothetical protein [Lysinibacillus sp. SGAir0095]QCR33441.1 hypothetical protein C1N55_15365 [Lysinibacillus sp. SGAir0095]